MYRKVKHGKVMCDYNNKINFSIRLCCNGIALMCAVMLITVKVKQCQVILCYAMAMGGVVKLRMVMYRY